jgi:cysteine synthase A
MNGKYETILETVGGTPVVKINKIAPAGVNLYVKVEAFNPMGSVKDRMALAIIEDAERSGKLSPGQTVIEATSGNTGIGLAMVCAQKGYPLVVTMAENFSTERRKLMRFLGAKVVLTPASARGTGMLAKAVELAETHGWFLARQFENEANADVHSRTTAQEILADFEGERLDYWVTGYGTGGTLKGVARVLAKERPETRIVVCEPDNSPLLGSGVVQPEPSDGGLAATHPVFRPHLMQGWTPDFIAKLADDARADKLIDGIVPINGEDAVRVSKDLAQKEGIFVGISSGATLAGALRVCESASEGTTVLCMLPDTGERYLTTPLFEEVATEMSDEEIDISQSSPNFRFDAPACAVPGQSTEKPVDSTREVEDLVEKIVGDPEAVRRVRHSLPFGRPRFGGVPEERSWWKDPFRPQQADDFHDHPAGLCRWRVRRWMLRDARGIQGGSAAETARDEQRGVQQITDHRPLRLSPDLAAPALAGGVSETTTRPFVAR